MRVAFKRALGSMPIALLAVVGALGALIVGLVGPAPVLAGPTSCVGDCQGDGMVTIEELILGVNIALGQNEVASCLPLDANGDGMVTIEELVAAVLNAFSACAPKSPFERGLSNLAAGNLIAATAAFAEAHDAQPGDPAASLYLAVGRLLTNAAANPQALELLGRGGVAIRGGLENVCGLHSSRPHEVPETAPRSGEIIDALRTLLVPELDEALALLTAISPDAVIAVDLHLAPECLRGGDPGIIEVDHADILGLVTALRGVRALIELSSGFNFDMSLREAATLPPRMVFDSSPDLLTLRSADSLSAARDDARLALTALIDTIDTIRSETDDQSDDILVIVPGDNARADQLRQLADLLRQSLDGEVVLPTEFGVTQPERLNLNPLFSAAIPSLRGFVAFDDESVPDPYRFPDPTFGGIAADLTQQEINKIVGLPECAICQTDDDCDGIRFPRSHCYECAQECSGSVKRCTSGFQQCEDGYYY